MLHVKVLTFNPVQENTYVVFNEENECVIVDPGCYFNEEKAELVGYLETKKLNPIRLLNTHCHLDHVFGNKFIAEKYNLELYAHSLEKQMLQMAPTSGLMYNLPFDNYVGEFRLLNEGDTVALGSDILEIFHTPGHSPGSICFYNKEGKFIISGDVLFQSSIGRTDLPFGNHEQLLESIRTKLFVLPDDVKVYCGHGAPTTVGYEKLHNPFLN